MNTSDFIIAGMTCGHCVAAVSGEVSKIDGVTAVDIDLAEGRMRVQSTTPIDHRDIAGAVDEAGYELVS